MDFECLIFPCRIRLYTDPEEVKYNVRIFNQFFFGWSLEFKPHNFLSGAISKMGHTCTFCFRCFSKN